ncbi:MAG: hypothetical protein WCV00_16845 [Verrucomicrobiia bacterium]
MEKPPIIQQPEPPPSRFPLWLALGANAANFLMSIQFYFVPSGAHIRPMAWGLWVIVVGLGGSIALPLVFDVNRRHWRKVWPWLTVLLALTPFPLAMAMLAHASKVRGFFIAD